MILLPIAATVVLAYMLTVAAHNAKAFPRLAHIDPASLDDCPPVSILIPARNEAANIGQAVTTLLRSTYPHFEVIVLDDGSEDGTAEIALQAAHGDDRLSVMTGAPLPDGWLGKPWACHQLAQRAAHDLLVFADADVRWTPHALSAIVSHQRATGADLLAVWPTQLTLTWGERLIVPLMAFVLLAYLPVVWAHDPNKITAAAANGQCMVFTRSAYRAIGGHSAVRSHVLDDVSLALLVKRHRQRLRLVDGAGLVLCRMYQGWLQATDGYTKNILAAHANSIPLLLISTLGHLILFVGPWLWLAFSTQLPGWPLWPVILIAAGLFTRALTAATAGLPLRDAWLMPLSVLLASQIALRALWMHLRHGAPEWKGRRILTRPTNTP